MSKAFEELDWQKTPIGEVSLRRRRALTLGVDVFGVKLGDEFLMSSLFTAAEIELARLGLAPLQSDDLDVVVGGLGLGYTAAAALEDARVNSLMVIEALGPVIDWHRRGLLPVSERLCADERCTLVQDDFFTWARTGGADASAQRYHAILLDIDHTPHALLHPSHAAFYSEAGLSQMAQHLHPGGVFALWSDAAPDDDFMAMLGAVFEKPQAHVVRFANPLRGGESTNTVYVARTKA